jgi:hypothetical protein
MKLAQIQLGHLSMSTTTDVYVHSDDRDLERGPDVLVESYGLENLPTDLPTKPC